MAERAGRTLCWSNVWRRALRGRAADALRIAGIPYDLIDQRQRHNGAMPPVTLPLVLLDAVRNGRQGALRAPIWT